MKTTLELPDSLLRQAKATAAVRGQSLKDFFTEALREKLAVDAGRSQPQAAPPWMEGFGELRHLRKHTAAVQARIEEDELDAMLDDATRSALKKFSPEERRGVISDALDKELQRRARLEAVARMDEVRAGRRATKKSAEELVRADRDAHW